MSVKNIAGRNHIFSPLRIETELIENLLSLRINENCDWNMNNF